MSTTIDNRVVQMTFNNKSFEKGVEDTLKTLDRLNKSLEFKDASKGFNDIQSAADKTDLSKIADSVESLKDRFSGLGIIGMQIWSKIGDAAWNLITGPFKKVESAISGTLNTIETKIKTGGWNRALNLDKAENMIKNLGYAWDSAGKEMAKTYNQTTGKWEEKANIYKSVNDAVSGTAYSLDEAAVASGNFLAAGVEGGKELTETLQAVMGVASTYGKDFNQVAGYFQKVATAGVATKSVLSDMQMVGIEYASVLTEYLGISQDELDEALKKGLISFDQFRDAYLSKFGDSLGKANDTYEGAVSNLNSALGRIGAKFAEPLLKQLIHFANLGRLFANQVNKMLGGGGIAGPMQVIIDAFKNASTAVLKFFAVLETGQDGVTRVVGLTANAQKIAAQIVNAFNALIKVGAIVFKVFKMIGEAFVKVFMGEVKKGPSLLTQINRSLNGVIRTLNANHDVIVNGLSGFFYILKLILSILAPILKFALKIVGVALKIITVLTVIVSNLITIIAESKLVKTVLSGLKSVFKTIGNFVKNAVKSFTDFIKSLNLTEKAIKIFSDIWTILSGAILIVWNLLSKAFKGIGDAFKSFNDKHKPMETAINVIKNAFGFLHDILNKVLEKFGNLTGIRIHIPTLDELKETAGNVRDKIIAVFEDPGAAADAFIEKLKEVKDFLGDKFGDVVDTINEKFNTFKDWLSKFTSGFGDAKKSMEDFSDSDGLETVETKMSILERIGSVMDNFGKVLDFLWGVLKSIGTGIVDGLKTMFEKFGDLTGVKNFQDFLDFIAKVGDILIKFGWAEAATGIGQFFGTLSDAMKKGMGGNSASVLKTLPDAMLKIAVALGVMALVVIALGSIKPEAAEQAKDILAYLTVLAIVMALVVKKLGSLKKSTESSIELTNETGKKLKVGKSFGDTLAKTLGKQFGSAAKIAATGFEIQAIGLAVLEILGGITILARVLTDFEGNFNWQGFWAAIIAFGVIMVALGVFLKIIFKSLKSVSESTSDEHFDRGGEKKQGKVWTTSKSESSTNTSTPGGAIAATALLIASIGAAVLVMATAMAILGALPKSVLEKGGLALAAIVGVLLIIMAALMGLTKLMSKGDSTSIGDLAKQFAAMAAFIIAIAAAILLLLPAILILGGLMEVNEDMIWKGIGAVALIGLAVAVCAAVAGQAEKGGAAIASLIGTAIVIYVLLSQIRKIAQSEDIDLAKLITSFVGVAAILFLSALLMKMADKVQNALHTMGLIMSLATMVGAVGLAISSVASGDILKTWNAVGAIVVLIAAVGGVMLILSKIAGPVGITLIEGIAVAMVGMGAAVFLLAAALKLILPLVDQIYDNRDGVRKKLQAFADIIAAVVIGFIAALCESLAAESLHLINALGRLVLNILVGIIDWICANAIEIGSAIGNLLAALVIIIAEALRTFIGNLLAVIREALGIHSPSKVFNEIGMNILKGLIKGLTNLGPLGEAVGKILDMILSPIIEMATTIIEGGEKIIGGIIKGIKNQFETLTGIVSSVLDIIKNPFDLENWANLGKTIVNGIKNGLEAGLDIIQGAVDILKAPIEGLQNLAEKAIETAAGYKGPKWEGKDAKEKKAEQQITEDLLANREFALAIDSYKMAAKEYARLINKGYRKVKVRSEMLKDINGNVVLDGNHNPIWRDVYETRLDLTENEKKALATQLNIMQKKQEIIESSYEDAVKFYESQDEDLKNRLTEIYVDGNYIGGSFGYRSGYLMGSMLGDGVIDGLQKGMSAMAELGDTSMTQFVNGARAAADINSPSKVFNWIGKMIIAGLNIGLENQLPTTMSIMETAVGNIEDITSDASITPVFNLTDFQNGANRVASTLTDLNTNIPNSVDLLNNTTQSRIEGLNGAVDTLSANMSTADLQRTLIAQNAMIETLSSKLESMGVYLDSGAIVGGIIDQIDRSLGFRAGQVGRSARA